MQEFGTICLNAAKDSSEDAEIASLMQLLDKKGNGWESYPDEPIVSVNVAASAGQVGKSMGALLKKWKTERNLGDQRDRSDKYSQYLAVWDLREGWNGQDYGRGQEKTFIQVARQLNQPLATVASRYQSAFQLITGHSYSPEKWIRIFGPRKLSALWPDNPSAVNRKRPQRSPVRRPVSEATLGAPIEAVSRQKQARAEPGSDYTPMDVLYDVQELISQGLSDREIVDMLELPPGTTPLIADLRDHIDLAQS